MTEVKLTKKLQADIAKALGSNLPEHVCGFVKDRLDEADKMEKRLDELSNEITALKVRNEELEELNHRDSKLKTWQEELVASEAELTRERAEFERDRTVFSLQHQLEAFKQMNEHTMAVNLNLTKNLERRREMIRGESVVLPPYETSPGYNQAPMVHDATHIDTEKEVTRLEGEL